MAALHLLSSSSDEDGDSSQGDSGEDMTTPRAQSVALGMVIAWRKWICCDGYGM